MLDNIIVDCDGVVKDWHLGFYHWMRAKGETVLHPYPDSYAMTSAHPGKTKDEIFAQIPIFNRTPEFGALPDCAGAIEGIAALRAAFPAAKLVCLTAVGDHPDTHRYRTESLKNLNLDELILVPIHLPKKGWLEKFEGRSMFVEDHPGHAAAAAELGMLSILIDRPWNREELHPGVRRAADWTDIVEIAKRTFLDRAAA